MQLLKITTTPMKYELEIQHAKLEYQKTKSLPTANIVSSPGKLELHSQNAKLKLSSYQARKSLGLVSVKDAIRTNAEQSLQTFRRNIRSTVETGKLLAQKQNDVTTGDIIRQKMAEQPSSYTLFLPSGGVDISWEPNSLQVQYTPGETEFQWEFPELELIYTPGSVKINIIEYASIDIEYLGTPFYIPKSADPNYVPPNE